MRDPRPSAAAPAAALAALLLLPALAALPAPGGAEGGPGPITNEAYQPTNLEFLVRTSEDLDPLVEEALGDSDPDVEVARSPPGRVEPGEVVAFDAAASRARHGALFGGQRIARWVWDFGDGAQALGPLAQHAWARPGLYRVSLVVHDDTGWRAGTTLTVEVGQAPCGTSQGEVWIPTPEDARLHGYLALPPGPGPFPAVLQYGPYIPAPVSGCNDFVRNGYAYAWVAAPGRGRSEGRFDLFGPATQAGGVAAVGWLAAQPWSNGKVGMVGTSGPAVAALLTAAASPPALAAVVAKTSYADLYRDLVYAGGVPNTDTFVNLWLPLLTAGDALHFLGPGPQHEVPRHAVDNALLQAELLLRPHWDAWWAARAIVDQPPPQAAVLYYGNHRDLWPRSTVEIARWIAPAGGRVVALPGGHGAGDTTGWEPGTLHGGEARLWFERFLQGVPNGVEQRPPVLTFSTFGGDAAAAFTFGRWEQLEGWPSAATAPLRLWLHPGSGDGASPLHHALGPAPPAPGDLVLPTALPWGPAQGAASDNTAPLVPQAGGLQHAWEPTALVFETPALADDLRVNGPAALSFHATVLGPDLGFTAHVHDVWPDGSSHYVAKGALLASHRALDPARSLHLPGEDGAEVLLRPWHPHTTEAARPVPAGEPARYDLEVWGIHNTFRAGHRLRLVLAAQDLGWRTHAEPGPAALVHHDALHPSALHLAVLPLEASRHPFPFGG